MVPLSIQEVREPPASYMNEIVEGRWDDGSRSDLEVEACLLCQSQQLLEDRPGRPLKDRVDAAVNKA